MSVPTDKWVRLPLELVRMVVDDLPREDLYNARFFSKGFAGVIAENLFQVIPLWISLKSLNAITGLSESLYARDHVQHIVFSTLRFIDHKEEAQYLAEVKNGLELHTDSLNTSALQYGKHMAAYHASIKAQRFLADGNLDMKVLARAFKQFPNLKKITIDHQEKKIGVRQIISDFGLINAIDLLTYNGSYTVPTLMRALSEAGVQLSKLRIGYDEALQWRDPPRISSANIGKEDYLTGLTSNTMFRGFCSSGASVHAHRVLRRLRVLDIMELKVKDERSDLLKMGSTIKHITKLTETLEKVEISEISPQNFMSDLKPLSLENLFEHENCCCRLKVLTLHNLRITVHEPMVAFLYRHARILQKVEFHFVELSNVLWSTVLDELRAFIAPNNFSFLRRFDLYYCFDRESHDSQDPDAVDEIRVARYILHQTNRNPLHLPYDDKS